ncbi:methyl-galactoside transport system ATP-binding protein/inositol transport system ATP-binding protein [Ruminiclostridium sufflavum DSM 19573]|uniref:Ribose/galactose/methyl galactoside import ATP-binding protein n=1 Tax=Ruminiclostridium sufflavum DSM 19573 TaxID=1121337 RepID=A0A318XKG8_9FIRM|nr:sugar ABC transporter ATP-binding protein [Ruminiclostridium sufflavum]PYG87940.1 methyl-galactoside transport system ATP-binding protein/inositol transport system ATP-binding protein [Ruminiclostridium sufflavum DSM 19573]
MIVEENEYLFEMRGVTKSFPGVLALDDVTLKVKAGSVHALCGENGAGKSTLMKVLAGIHKQDKGEVVINGQAVQIINTKDAINKGISMIHQELNFFPQMTVEANLFIGRESSVGFGIVDKKKNIQEIQKIMCEYGIDINVSSRMHELTIAKQQMVEIVRAIAFNAKIIIMDEPTSSLTDNEIATLFRIIRKLTAEGKSIIYISHKLDEIFEISDTVTVIRDGRTIGTYSIQELDKKKIITLMVGRELKDVYDKRQISIGAEKLRVENFSRGNEFKNISFEVRKGEIFGFLGLVGAGRSEVAEAVFGLKKPDTGKVYIDGKEVFIRHAWNSIANKMAFITEDRRAYGLSLMHSVRQNSTIASMKNYCSKYFPMVFAAKEKSATQRMIDALKIKTPTQEAKLENLSGGNQQKVVISKWLLSEPEIMIMDEPTRGIDVGAKFEIYKIMSDMAQEGKAIIMISSEMPELLGMCDRILVMCAGKQTGIFTRKEFEQVKLMSCATGTQKEDLADYVE